MRVKITVTLDIDPQAWMDTYDVSRTEVRADVNEWALHLLRAAASDNGVIPEKADA